MPDDDTARRTQASFGYEWTHFNDWRPSGETNFNDYFAGPRSPIPCATSVVLDAGCGMGRHARQIAPFAGQVVAVDFSRAIDQAARETSPDLANVDCVQADLLALPLADDAFDFVYSLGVLHHLGQTERGARRTGAQGTPGRPAAHLSVLETARLEGRAARRCDCRAARDDPDAVRDAAGARAACLVSSSMAAVVIPYRALSQLGVRAHEDWPLFVYSKYPFNVLYNDQFDRFSAPIEKRYDADEVQQLLERAGLEAVEVRSCFGWIAEGTRPSHRCGA